MLFGEKSRTLSAPPVAYASIGVGGVPGGVGDRVEMVTTVLGDPRSFTPYSLSGSTTNQSAMVLYELKFFLKNRVLGVFAWAASAWNKTPCAATHGENKFMNRRAALQICMQPTSRTYSKVEEAVWANNSRHVCGDRDVGEIWSDETSRDGLGVAIGNG